MTGFRNLSIRKKIFRAFFSIIALFVVLVAVAIFAVRVEIIIGAAIIILIVIFAEMAFLLKYVAEPAERLAQSVKNFAGNGFKGMVSQGSDDELGQLSDHLLYMSESLAKLREATHKVEQKARRREFGNMLPTDLFLGDYKNIVSLTNSIISNYENELENAAVHMEKFASGDFIANVGYGQKSRHIAAISALSHTLNEISTDVYSLASSASAGNFKKSMDAEKYNGNWKKLAHSLDELLNSLVLPIKQTREMLDAVAAGKLNVKVSADAKGEFLKLKTSANNAAAALAKYVKTIVHALENIDKKSKLLSELPQDFTPIKSAISNLGTGAANAASVMPASKDRAINAVPKNMNKAENMQTNQGRDGSKGASKRVSGAMRVSGMDTNAGGTPSYMKPDFGKY